MLARSGSLGETGPGALQAPQTRLEALFVSPNVWIWFGLVDLQWRHVAQAVIGWPVASLCVHQ